MRKVFYLKTCSTCTRILAELDLSGFEKVEIKSQGISGENVDAMRTISGSYESLFSKRAMKYKALGLASKGLQEGDFRNYIVEEYTFLKRPVFILDENIFIGNSKGTIDSLKEKLALL